MRNQFGWVQYYLLSIFILIGIIVSPAMANYQSQEGRWMQQEKLGTMPDSGSVNPPMQYSESLSLYLSFQNMPILRIDPHGLWGTSVHLALTTKLAMELGYKPIAALEIGFADEAVDSGGTGPLPWQDQSYHFNRNLSGGMDTRMVHFNYHYKRAMIACLPPMDMPEVAVRELGTALHPLQDWVAHGDYAMKNTGKIYVIHNSNSPQWSYGLPGKYPDDITLDVSGSTDGRATKDTIIEKHYVDIFGVPRLTKYTDFAYYEKGSKRINMTRMMTAQELSKYYWFIENQGGCQCKGYILNDRLY